MKKLILSLAAVVLFSISQISAYPILGTYAGFTFVTSSSGWLYCVGQSGVCANVVGDQIFFGNYVGNWYGTVKDADDGSGVEYMVEDVQQE